MAREFDISREAAARRYVALHGEDLAVVFSQNGRFLYAERSRGCPWLHLTKGVAMPALPGARAGGHVSDLERATAEDWLSGTPEVDVAVQVLHQQNGYALTLLRVAATDKDEQDKGVEDAFDRFSRFGER